MSRERRGLQDGNDRVANIARWLGTPIGHDDQDAMMLVLWVWRHDGEPNVVARWRRKEVTRDLAPEVNAFMTDFAEDEQANCRAKLSWCLTNGEEWCSKTFRVICSAKPDRSDQLDGSLSSVMMQLQRHNEAYAQRLVELTDTVERRQGQADERWERMFGIMDRQLERLALRAETAEQDAEDMANAAEQATEVAEQATRTAEEAMRAAEENKGDDTTNTILKLTAGQLGLGERAA